MVEAAEHRDEQRPVLAHALAQPVRGAAARRGELREGVVAAAHEQHLARVQPYVMEAAALCDGGCNPM